MIIETESQSTDGLLCSINLVDRTGKVLLNAAAPHLPKALNEAARSIPIGSGVASCGSAAFERRTVTTEDIANDPAWKDFKAAAAAAGIAACCSMPILSSRDELLGTIAMYYQQCRQPSQRDRQLVAQAIDLAGIAIERMRGEELLRINEEQLRATFNQAAVGIAIAGMDGCFVESNGKFRQILRYSKDELLQKTFLDLTHPDDIEKTNHNVKRLINEEVKDCVYEKRYIRGDGTAVWCLTTITLLKDSLDRPIQYLGVIEDITDRKESEQDRAQINDVLDRSLNEIYICDFENLLFLYVNHGALQNLGYSLDEMRRMTPIDIKPSFDEKRYREMIDPLLSGREEKIVFETVHRRGNKTEYPVEVHLQAAKHLDQKILLAVIIDITERKRAEEALRRSEQDLRSLANSIPQLAWMADPDGYISWFNRGWYDYTGTTFEQMCGSGWQSLTDPEILPEVRERWNESLRTKSPFEMEFPIRGIDGVFRWFLTRVNPVLNEDGNVLRWFGTNTDVDESRRGREALRDETDILELLNKTGTSIASNLNLDEIVQTVTDSGRLLVGAKFGAFFYNVVNAEGESYFLYTLSGARAKAFEKFGLPRSTPVFQRTFHGEGVLRSPDITKDPRYGQMSPHHGMPTGHLPVRSYLAVPVISRTGDVIGGLFFGHSDVDVFTRSLARAVDHWCCCAGFDGDR